MHKFRLSRFQISIINHILDGAEIQVTDLDGTVKYDIVFENGNIESIQQRTFESLRDQRLISIKYRPSIETERWS